MRPLRTASLFLILTLMVSPVMAQDMPTQNTLTAQGVTESEKMIFLRKMPQTHPETILLTYYQLANAQPPLSTWAALSPYLENASDGDIPHIIQREENRLAKANATREQDDVLSIQTRININDYSTLREVLTINEFNPQTFFNYSLYGEHVAVVPKDIVQFHEIPLKKAAMDEILSKTRNTTQVWGEIILKPTYVDTKQPFMYNNKAYKLMLADIGEIRLWTNNSDNPTLLWTYRADWYEPKTSADLMKLKSGNEAQ